MKAIKPKIKIIGIDILQKRIIRVPYDYKTNGEILIEIGEKKYSIDEKLLNEIGNYLVKNGFFREYEVLKLNYETKTNVLDVVDSMGFDENTNRKRKTIREIIERSRNGEKAKESIEKILEDDAFLPIISGHRLQRKLIEEKLLPKDNLDTIAIISIDRLIDDSAQSIALNSTIGEGTFYATRLAGAGDKIPICSVDAYKNILKETSNKELSKEEAAIGIVLHELMEHHFSNFLRNLKSHDNCCLTHPPKGFEICENC
jgi:hypothetical protein